MSFLEDGNIDKKNLFNADGADRRVNWAVNTSVYNLMNYTA